MSSGDLAGKVERGEVSVSAAADVAKLPKAEQVEIVARGPDEIVREANRIKREKKEKRREERRHEVANLAASGARSARYVVMRPRREEGRHIGGPPTLGSVHIPGAARTRGRDREDLLRRQFLTVRADQDDHRHGRPGGSRKGSRI